MGVQLKQVQTKEEPRSHARLQTFSREKIGPQNLLSQAIQDRYRYPEGLLEFSLDGPLSAPTGYFRFGAEATCFGRSRTGVGKSPADAAQFEAFGVPAKDGKLLLPFDPTEILDNLRLERYAHREGQTLSLQAVLKRLYYMVRPVTTLSMRRRIQRFRARNWMRMPFPKWPVDITVEDVCERLLLSAMQAKGLDRVPFVWFWPKGAQSCVTMTHDVETEAGYNFCPELMDIDNAFGIKSSFQIVPEGRYQVFPEFLATLRHRGFEVAVQDLNHDGRLFDDHAQFLRRAEKINQYAKQYGATGFRAAVLYRKPEWYGALDFSYDMSIPNVGHLDPQSGGCCTVLPYFIGDMLEIPVTTVQDYMLFHILDDHSIDLWKTQIQTILKKNGLMSFIVHPDYIIAPQFKPLYESLLGHLQGLRGKAWFALPNEIDAWWRARSQMRVVRQGNSWCIEGDRRAEAVLAYARNVNGKLVYETGCAAAV